MEPEGMDFDLVAASLRADAGDIPTFVELLAEKLERALPLQTSVERRGRGLLSREKRVQRIEVRVGEEMYQVSVTGAGIETTRASAVRGIVLKRDQLPLDAWIDMLSRKLAEEAGSSEQARLALQRLLGA